MKLSIQIRGQPAFDLEMDVNGRIRQLKRRIQKKTGIPAEKQTLRNIKDKILEDKDTFLDCQFLSTGDIVVVEEKPKININLKMPLEIYEDDTVLNLKEKIRKMGNVPLDKEVVVLVGDAVLADNLNLSNFKNEDLEVKYPELGSSSKRKREILVLTLQMEKFSPKTVAVDADDAVEALDEFVKEITGKVEVSSYFHENQLLKNSDSFRTQGVRDDAIIQVAFV